MTCALDRAAWGSITASTPFPPLPKEFPGQILGLRFYYFYNLQPGADLKLGLRLRCEGWVVPPGLFLAMILSQR